MRVPDGGGQRETYPMPTENETMHQNIYKDMRANASLKAVAKATCTKTNCLKGEYYESLRNLEMLSHDMTQKGNARAKVTRKHNEWKESEALAKHLCRLAKLNHLDLLIQGAM